MTETAQNADFRRKPLIFADSPLLLEIPALGGRRKPQKTADSRRKPKIFAENRRKPQIGLCHLRCVTFSSALQVFQTLYSNIHRPAPVQNFSLPKKMGGHRGKISVVDMVFFLVFIGFSYIHHRPGKFFFEARKVPQKIFFRWWSRTFYSSLYSKRQKHAPFLTVRVAIPLGAPREAPLP